MKTRIDALRFMSYSIVNGKGIKIYIDGYELRPSMRRDLPYVIWHNKTTNDIVAIIHEGGDNRSDFVSDWASQPLADYQF